MSTYRSRAWKRRRWLAQGRRCPLCKLPIGSRSLATARVNLDHVRPVSHGGDDRDENLQLVHRRCNDAKGDQCPGCDACKDGPEAYLLWRVLNPQVGRIRIR